MKKMIFFFTLALHTSVQAASITLRTDLWCPYACDPKSDKPGFMVEIAREIFKKHGYTIDYNVMNWPRAIADVKSGKYDGLVGCSKSDVEGFIIPKTPAGIMTSYYYVLKDDPWTYKTVDSLKNKKIGVINDYTYGDEIDNAVKNKNPAFRPVSGENPLMRLVQMTENKRIDGFVENPLVLNYVLKNSKKEMMNFKVASRDLANDPDLFIAFAPTNPKSKEYARILDEGMGEIRRNGKLKEILSRYGLTDWK